MIDEIIRIFTYFLVFSKLTIMRLQFLRVSVEVDKVLTSGTTQIEPDTSGLYSMKEVGASVLK